MKLKLWQKNILSMLVIVGVGFILFIVAFLLAYLVRIAYNMVITGSIGFSWHYLNLILILLLSWLVFRTRLNDLIKATFLTLPLIVIVTEVRIQFYTQPVLVWVIGTVIIGAISFYLYKTKRSWLYYFATFYVIAVEIFVMLSGMDI